MNEPGCYRLPLDRYPGMNPFVLDWLAGDERFLPRGGQLPSAVLGSRGRPPSTLVDALIASNKRWGLNVEDDVRRWADGKTFTIVAGQQVGFAGGPLFTLVKLASLLKMKRDNEARGVSTTVFFWLATEDHDFAEAARIALPSSGQQDLKWLRATRSGESREVVGRLAIPESLTQELVTSLQIGRPRWLRPGVTFGDSFAELIATVFKSGFILVDSLLPEVRRAGAPLFESIIKRWDEIQSAITTRSEALQRAGYSAQIVPRAGEPYTLLYNINAKGERELLQKPSLIEKHESISTSGITRPLLQDFVLRPDIFVGGPAEVAYYAQVAPLHKLLGIALPRVALRGHVLVAPRRVVRYLSRFEIGPEEVFTTPEQLAAAHEPRGVSEVQSVAGEAEAQLRTHIEKIRELALPADHAVARSINRSIGHIEYHFKKLAERAIRGLVRKDKERFQAARELTSTFYPDRQVQDRVVAWLPFWLEHGDHLVDCIVNEVEPDAAAFKIVSL